jgi:hypothetical protein
MSCFWPGVLLVSNVLCSGRALLQLQQVMLSLASFNLLLLAALALPPLPPQGHKDSVRCLLLNPAALAYQMV